MARGLPMRCERCGATWEQTNFIQVADGGSVDVHDSSFATTCPVCQSPVQQSGSWRVTPRGWMPLYEALREATSQDYETLAGVLRRARQSDEQDGHKVAEEIKASLPSLRGLADFIDSERGDRLSYWLVVLLTLIALWKSFNPSESPHESPAQPVPQRTVVQVIESPQPTEAELQRLIQEAVAQVERGSAQAPSAKCSCGSGKRYKRCCGAVTK